MSNPRVSVVVTTFNRRELVLRALESVIEQDFDLGQTEIILIDDGSTDQTAGAVEARFGGRVMIHSQANAGITAACAAGFALARGEFVAQLDSDDVWYPDKLSSTLPLFDQADDVVGVLHDLDIVDQATGQRIGRWWEGGDPFRDVAPVDILSRYLEGESVRAVTSGAVWRRRALSQILPFPAGLWGFNDTYIFRNIMFYGRVCGIRRPLGAYYLHGSNDFGVSAAKSLERLARHEREARLVSESFNARCRQFDRWPGVRRRRIQRYAIAQLALAQARYRGPRAYLAEFWRNGRELDWTGRLHLASEAFLPTRIHSLVKHRVLRHLGTID